MNSIENEERVRLTLALDAAKRMLEAELARLHPTLYAEAVDIGIKEAIIGLDVTMSWLIDLKCYETLPVE